MQFPSVSEKVLPHEIKFSSPNGFSQTSGNVDRFIGSIVGLAVGDALGASAEFRPHQYFVEHPVRDMEGGGTWGLKSGQWTDDTSMALCLASSLISKRCFDPYDQMVRYKWWYKHGYMSSTGHCFDIGNATRDALEEFSRRQKALYKVFHCHNEEDCDKLSWDQVQSVKEFNINCSSVGVAGNGALMRLTPIPLFFYQYPAIAVEYAGRSACLTHGDKKAVDACRYYAALIVAAVQGQSITELLRENFYDTHKQWFGSTDLHPEILSVARGSYKRKNGYEDGIRGKGYIVNALEAALWAFWSHQGSFENGALAAVNLGDDTDTTAAIYGQLAGACYGYQNIPKKWTNKLYAHDLLFSIGQWIYYEGKKYKPNEKEQKMNHFVSTSTIIPSNQHKKIITHQVPIHSSDSSQWEGYQLEDKHLLRDQRSIRELPVVDNQYSRPTQKYQPNETGVLSPETFYHSFDNKTYDDKSRMQHPAREQTSKYRTDLNLSSAYNSPSTRTRTYSSDPYLSPSQRSNYLASAYGTDINQRSNYYQHHNEVPSYRTNIDHISVHNSDFNQRNTYNDYNDDYYYRRDHTSTPSPIIDYHSNYDRNNRYESQTSIYRRPTSTQYSNYTNPLNSSYDQYNESPSYSVSRHIRHHREPISGINYFMYNPYY